MTTTDTATMRAVVYEQYGSADVLHPAQIALPSYDESEVLVRVHAAGVDRGAWHMMTGKPYLGRLVFGVRRPRNPVLGIDVAGTVVDVGAAVTSFSPGDEVYGFAHGSFAEYAVVAEQKLARKPANLTFVEAAVVPVSAATALQALTEHGRVASGQAVLVIGASGGVGSYAVQLAKAFGAHVNGTSSPGKVDLVRSLGAEQVLDYTSEDFADGTRRYDLIVDIGGNPSLSRLRRALSPTGTLVITGGEQGGSFSGGMNRQLRAVAMSPFVRQRLVMFIARERASDLERLTELIEAGQVTPTVDRIYSLEQVPDALRYLEAGKARGKVAIAVAPGADTKPLI